MHGKLGPTVASVVMAMVLAACGSSVKLEDKAPVESRTPTDSTATPGGSGAAAGGAGAGGASGVTRVDLNRADDVPDANLPRVVYFDFDSFVVKDDFRPVVELHAKRLAAQRSRKLALEGHTDERGGSEYNLALGQKRAEAVAKALVLLGARENQLEPVSFGKERPAVQGSNEEAWARNRRVELKDR
jgi:peptidoglycan-associated lipoprotein